MNKSQRTSGAGKFLLFTLVFLILTDAAILLDIPVLRQVLGFLFFSTIPGLLILNILKLNKLGPTERVVLSVGLSIASLMLGGLLINWAYFSLGYATPLSAESVIVSFSVIVILLSIIAYKTNPNSSLGLSSFKLNTKEKGFLLLPAIFPLLSILGMYLMNTTDNNMMLIVLLLLIPAYAVLIVILHRQVPEKIYPPIILLTSISLLLLMALRSSHIIGADSHVSYYLFQLTCQEEHWRIFIGYNVNSCLSVTLLPAVYQSFLNMDPEYLFKILYPVTLSVSPLVVYIIARKYVGSLYAFLTSFFFLSQIAFLWTTANSRTSMAIFFFALVIMVMFHEGINNPNKKLLFIIFAAACIVSHYATTYIFLLVLLFTWIGMKLWSWTMGRGRSQPQANISLNTVLLFFVMLFFWYSQVTVLPFNTGVRFVATVLTHLDQFLLLASRGAGVTGAMGGILPRGIPYQIEFVLSWLTIAFIGIGILSTLARHKRMLATTDLEANKPNFLSAKIDTEYFVICLACTAVLIFSVVLPFILKGYGMDRLYLQMIVALSPFFVFGVITLAQFLRARPYWLILVVLIPYFMCTTGMTYQTFGVPRAITLNSQGEQYDLYYVHEQESKAAQWLKNHIEEENAEIHSDQDGTFRLISQGDMRPPKYITFLTEGTQPIEGGYIYLRYSAAVDGRLTDDYHQWHDIAEHRYKFVDRSKVYVNGGSEIYR